MTGFALLWVSLILFFNRFNMSLSSQSLFLVRTNIWVSGSGFSMSRFVYAFAPQSRTSNCIHGFVLVPSTRSQFGPSTSNTYTVLYVHKHHAYVTPLSFCKYRLVSKIGDLLFLQPVHLRSTITIIAQRIQCLESR